MLKINSLTIRGVSVLGTNAVAVRIHCEDESAVSSSRPVQPEGSGCIWPANEGLLLGSEDAVAVAQSLSVEVLRHAGKPRERVLLRASVPLHDLYELEEGHSDEDDDEDEVEEEEEDGVGKDRDGAAGGNTASRTKGKGLSGWYSLYPVSSSSAPTSTSSDPGGEIYLRIVPMGKLPERAAARPSSGKMGKDEQDGLQLDLKPNTLRVTLHACRALAGAGPGDASSSSSSPSRLNPCAKVALGKMEVRTGVCAGTDAPVWNDTMAFPATDPLPHDGLRIIIESVGVLRSEPLGVLEFHTEDLTSLHGACMRRWMPLLSPKGVFDRHRGEADVTLSWDQLPHDKVPKYARKLSDVDTVALAAAAAAELALARVRAAEAKDGDQRGKRDGAAGSGSRRDDGPSTPSRPGSSRGKDTASRGSKGDKRGSDSDGSGKGRADDDASIGPGGTPWGEVDNEADADGAAGNGTAEDEAESERKRLEEAAATPLREGDYQVTVHVIEARNLKPMDSTGTSDPVVYVDVLGKKQHTRIIPKRNNAVWDQTLAWSLPRLTADVLEEAQVRVAVYDADSFTASDMIGAYTFDLATVYARKNHEVWRQWVALVDDSRGNSSGLRGILKVSVTVMGPGDRPTLHAPGEEEDSEDPAAADGGPGDVRNSILLPPSLDRTLKFLVLTLYSADGLPSMDFLGGIDAFVKVAFGGGPPAKTRWVTVKGKGKLAVEWNTELWLPVLCPPLSDVVALGVWDFDRLKGNDLVATSHMRFRDIEGKALPPTYLPLYGAPPGIESGKDASTMNKFPALASHYRGRLLLGARVEEDDGSELDKVHTKSISRLPAAFLPSEETFILHALIVQGEELPSFSASAGNLFGLAPSDLGIMVCVGDTAVYTGTVRPDKGLARWAALLRAEIKLPSRAMVQGVLQDSPGRGKGHGRGGNKGKQARFRADSEFEYDDEEDGEGEAVKASGPVQDYDRWGGFSSPLPDTFIYLYRGNAGPLNSSAGVSKQPFGTASTSTDGPWKAAQPVCYARLPTGDIMKRGFSSSLLRWVDLQEVTAVNALGDEEKAGAVLMRLGIGSREDARQYAQDWDAEMGTLNATATNGAGASTAIVPSSSSSTTTTNGLTSSYPFELRVMAYRGADLPSADDDGSLDPYIKVRFNGAVGKTRWVPKTRYPGWFECVSVSTSLPSPNPRFAPRVHVEVWDHDDVTADDFVSELRFDLASPACFLTTARSLSSSPPMPTWFDLKRYETGVMNIASKAAVGQGKLLLAFQLVRKDSPGQTLPKPVLMPPYRDMWAELTVVGLRGCEPTGGMSCYSPFLEVDGGERGLASGATQAGGGAGAGKTDASSASAKAELGMTLANTGNRVRRTARSRKPTGTDPNFCERILLPIRVPLDPLFSPVLNIVARDWRLAGLSTPVIGTACVPLAPAIPWNPAYVPPGRGIVRLSLSHPDMDGASGSGDVAIDMGVVGDGDGASEDWASLTPRSAGKDEAEADNAPLLGAGGGDKAGHGQGDRKERRVGFAPTPVGASASSSSTAKGGRDPYDELADADDDGSSDGGVVRRLSATSDGTAGSGSGSGTGTGIGIEMVELGKGKNKGEEDGEGGSKGDENDAGPASPDSRASGETASDAGSSSSPSRPVPLAEGSKYTSMVDDQGLDHARYLLHLDGADAVNDGDDTARTYMASRRVYNAGLEDVFRRSPFDSWSLMKGQRVGRGRSLLSLGTVKLEDNTRQAGTLKGMLRLLSSPNEPPLLPPASLKSQPVVVRVYVLTGHDLMAHDDTGTSDPYVMVKLGGHAEGSRADYVNATLNPSFYRMYELKTSLPGPSSLEVQLWDRDLLAITSDDFIGSTTIDLEDRFFSPWWRGLGKDSQTHGRLRPVPVESRPLWCPTSTAPQGSIKLWVDILTPAQAARYPPVKITPPPPALYEVRLVVWGTRRVADAMNGRSSDLFVRASFPGNATQETDTHWRCKTGRASFNWRSKFTATLPMKTTQDAYLTLQLYDRDIAKSSDLISESTLNLAPHLRRAAKAGSAVHVFNTDPVVVGKRTWKAIERKRRKLERQAARLARSTAGKGGEGETDDEDDGGDGTGGGAGSMAWVTAVEAKKADTLLDEREGEIGGDGVKDLARTMSKTVAKIEKGKGKKGKRGSRARDVLGSDGDGAGDGNGKGKKKKHRLPKLPFGAAKDDGPPDDDVQEALAGGDGGSSGPKSAAGPSALQGKLPNVTPMQLFQNRKAAVMKLSSTLAGNEAGGAGGAAGSGEAKDGGDGGTAGSSPPQSSADAARDTVEKLKEMTGATELLVRPRHAQYLPMYTTDYATGEMLFEKVGELLISIEIMPVETAEKYPAGRGRTEPNAYPYLPPPVGRSKFTMNPFSLLGEMVGLRACLAFITSTVAGVGSTILMLGVPYLQSLLTLPYELMLSLGILSLILAFLSFVGCCARSCCKKKEKDVREVDVKDYAAALASGELDGEDFSPEDGEEDEDEEEAGGKSGADTDGDDEDGAGASPLKGLKLKMKPKGKGKGKGGKDKGRDREEDEQQSEDSE